LNKGALLGKSCVTGKIELPVVSDEHVMEVSRNISGMESAIEAELENLQRESFSYFVHGTNPDNGLVIDKTAPNWPAGIAAISLGSEGMLDAAQ
jgi:hypothetical protein